MGSSNVNNGVNSVRPFQVSNYPRLTNSVSTCIYDYYSLISSMFSFVRGGVIFRYYNANSASTSAKYLAM